MKKRIFGFFMAVLMLTALAVPASATARASDQIADFSTEVAAVGGGKVAIKISINGTGMMSEIGGLDVTVYEKWGNSWMIAAIYDKDDPGMSTTNDNCFGNVVYFYGNAGTQYKIEVTVFATDSRGTDSRMRTHYVTAK